MVTVSDLSTEQHDTAQWMLQYTLSSGGQLAGLETLKKARQTYLNALESIAAQSKLRLGIKQLNYLHSKMSSMVSMLKDISRCI